MISVWLAASFVSGAGSSRLAPVLKLQNISFRISRIDHTKDSDALHFSRRNSTDYTTAGRKNRLKCRVYILDQERKMPKPRLIHNGPRSSQHLIVTEYLQGGAVTIEARKPQVHTRQVRLLQRRQII